MFRCTFIHECSDECLDECLDVLFSKTGPHLSSQVCGSMNRMMDTLDKPARLRFNTNSEMSMNRMMETRPTKVYPIIELCCSQHSNKCSDVNISPTQLNWLGSGRIISKLSKVNIQLCLFVYSPVSQIHLACQELSIT